MTKFRLRHFIFAFLTVAVVAMISLLIGPLLPIREPAMGNSLSQRIEGQSVESYLKEVEKPFLADLHPGFQKQVHWAGEAEKKTPLGLVYFHGFSASPLDTSPMMARLAQEFGANLFLQRLSGHGFRNPLHLGDARWPDWLVDGEEAYQIGKKMAEQVVLVGTSTGALLAIKSALDHQSENHIKAVVLLSPNFMPQAAGAMFLEGPLGPLWARLFIGPERRYGVLTPAHEIYWSTHYPSRAVAELMNLVGLSQQWALTELHVPMLCIYTPEDKVVRVDRIEENCHTMKAKLQVVGNRHEMISEALGLTSTLPNLLGLTSEFIRSH
ncbi:MAG: hypothetical protein C5B49_12320 [Bdellovibrio sp.]|nr:MAG: hypothetical protein C5B49_12320 [Bdellovibrio sp.]